MYSVQAALTIRQSNGVLGLIVHGNGAIVLRGVFRVAIVRTAVQTGERRHGTCQVLVARAIHCVACDCVARGMRLCM